MIRMIKLRTSMVRVIISLGENEKYMQKFIGSCTDYEAVNGNKTAHYSTQHQTM